MYFRYKDNTVVRPSYLYNGNHYTETFYTETAPGLYQRQFMMTSSNGNIFRVTGHLCGEFPGLRWIPRTKASDAELLIFSLTCVWINGWVNNRETGDLRRHRAHYDVSVLSIHLFVVYTYSETGITWTPILMRFKRHLIKFWCLCFHKTLW